MHAKVIALIVLLACCGVGLYFLIHSLKSNSSPNSNPTPAPSPNPQPNPTPTPNPNPQPTPNVNPQPTPNQNSQVHVPVTLTLNVPNSPSRTSSFSLDLQSFGDSSLKDFIQTVYTTSGSTPAFNLLSLQSVSLNGIPITIIDGVISNISTVRTLFGTIPPTITVIITVKVSCSEAELTAKQATCNVCNSQKAVCTPNGPVCQDNLQCGKPADILKCCTNSLAVCDPQTNSITCQPYVSNKPIWVPNIAGAKTSCSLVTNPNPSQVGYNTEGECMSIACQQTNCCANGWAWQQIDPVNKPNGYCFVNPPNFQKDCGPAWNSKSSKCVSGNEDTPATANPVVLGKRNLISHKMPYCMCNNNNSNVFWDSFTTKDGHGFMVFKEGDEYCAMNRSQPGWAYVSHCTNTY